MLIAATSGCRFTAVAEVRLPLQGPNFRVECNYAFANCQHAAAAHCHKRYEPITRKNCPGCGKLVPPTPERNAPVQMPGYHGTFYFRCF